MAEGAGSAAAEELTARTPVQPRRMGPSRSTRIIMPVLATASTTSSTRTTRSQAKRLGGPWSRSARSVVARTAPQLVSSAAMATNASSRKPQSNRNGTCIFGLLAVSGG
jgi:hypothetical protein